MFCGFSVLTPADTHTPTPTWRLVASRLACARPDAEAGTAALRVVPLTAGHAACAHRVTLHAACLAQAGPGGVTAKLF